jgi:hypothetical protein
MIEKAINENQMALIEARDVVDGLRSQLNDFHGAFSSIVAGLGKIGFPERVFEADQGCLSILIPRFGIKDDLANFAAEMKLFDRDVGFISELATGSQPVRKLIELSTSSPWVLIGVPGATVLVFLQIVVAIQDIRLKTTELKNAMDVSQKAGYPKQILDEMKSEHDAVVGKKLEELVKQLMNEYSENSKRLGTEIEKPLGDAVGRIATRMDHGYQYEGDVKHIAEDPDKELDEHELQLAGVAAAVRDLTEKIEYSEITSQPVLGLPPPDYENREDP